MLLHAEQNIKSEEKKASYPNRQHATSAKTGRWKYIERVALLEEQRKSTQPIIASRVAGASLKTEFRRRIDSKEDGQKKK